MENIYPFMFLLYIYRNNHININVMVDVAFKKQSIEYNVNKV